MLLPSSGPRRWQNYLKGWNAAAARRLRADQTAASIFHHMKDNDKKGYTDLFRNALENSDHKMMKKLTQKRLHGRLKDRDEYTAWEFIANIPAEFNSFHEFVTAPASGFAVGRDGSTKDVLLHRDCADMATVLDLIGTEKYGEALEVGVRFLSVRYLMSRYRTEHPGAKDEKAMYQYAVKIRSHRALRGRRPGVDRLPLGKRAGDHHCPNAFQIRGVGLRLADSGERMSRPLRRACPCTPPTAAPRWRGRPTPRGSGAGAPHGGRPGPSSPARGTAPWEEHGLFCPGTQMHGARPRASSAVHRRSTRRFGVGGQRWQAGGVSSARLESARARGT